MAKLNQLAMAVNAAGALAVVVVGSYAANSFFNEDVTPACDSRYASATTLSLTNGSGSVASSIELQAQFGSDARGILENVDIVSSAKAPAPELLQVKLFKKPNSKQSAEGTLGGAGFSWQPASMASAEAACLAYNVLLPKEFAFAEGGVLPGLYGGDRLDPMTKEPQKHGIASLFRWHKEGTAGVRAHLASRDAGGNWFDEDTKLAIPRGKWTNIQQEIILNAPDKADGILRLWVDGVLQFERKNLAWRKDDSITIDGVAADVSYLKPDVTKFSNKTEALRIGQITASWQ